MDPYAVYCERLGLPPGASLDECEATFKKLSRTMHPDKRRDVSEQVATNEYMLLTEAIDKLRDPNRVAHGYVDDHAQLPVLNLLVEIPLSTVYMGGSYTTRFERKIKDIDGSIVSVSEAVEIPISYGIREGSEILMRGRGNYLVSHKKYQDLMVKISIADEDFSVINDNDLQIEIEIDLYTAIFGGVVDIPHPNGLFVDAREDDDNDECIEYGREMLEVPVPASAQNGSIIILADSGLRDPNILTSKIRGNLEVKVCVQIPDIEMSTLSPTEAKKMKKLLDKLCS